MTNTIDWRIVADIAIGAAIPALFVFLFATGRASRREMTLFVAGFLIGCSFEFYTWYLGPDFFYVKLRWPLPWPTYYICHSLWDAGLFMAGYYLCVALLKKPREAVCRSFDARELAIMTVWGAATAFLVELNGNGIIWQYMPQSWNPVWITLGGRDYTIFIQAVWIVVPSIFYFACIAAGRSGRDV